jgi:uncharacterized repeat protein (TIGR01451 family)
VNWGGWDPGGSGIATYDVQYTDAPGGIWADWQMNSTTTSASFSGTTGNTYYFRSRATDRAQNVEPWPPGDGDTQTAFYAWAITGTMRDSRETPLAGAVVTTTPEAFATSPSNSEGVYAAYIAHDAGMYSAAWGKKGYEDLPVTEFALSQDVQADMFLPPADNIIQDWGFESGSLGSGSWLTSGLYTPLVVDSPRHTGAYAVMLGRESSFAPPQNVSNTAPHSLQPQIAVDDLDTVHLVWTDAGIRYARRESDGTWSSPENVSTATSGLDDPQLAVGENEVVHVVWSDSSDIYYAQRASDGTWSPSQNLSDSPDEAGHPQVAVDGSGVVHVVWHDQSTGAADIYHAWRDGGGSWSSPQNLSDDPIESWSPQMAMDGNGAAHVVWWSAGGNNEVFYAMRGGDGIWSDPQNISDTPVWSEYPELVADANATVHVVWKDGDHPEYDVYYARRGSDGTWSSPANISNASANIWHSKPVLGPDGNLHVAWQQPSPSKTDIYYAFRRSEGTWSTPVNVSHSPSDARTATLTVDDHATVHLAWTEYIYPDDINVYYARRSSDETWSSPQNLTEGSGGWSWQPKIAVDGTETIHIVWAHNPDIYYRNLVPASETGDSAISQAVTVLNSDASPTLSFLHQLGGHHGTDGVWFSVGVDDGITATALFSTTTETDDWIHNWFDMTPWAGQTVTLTFNLHETVGYPTGWAYLDEITLGPAYPDLWVGKEASTRIAAPGDQVIYPISYGNRGGVAASSIQITDELPEGLSFEAASPPPSATTPSLVWDVGDLPAKSERYAIVVTTTVSDTAPLLSYLTNTVSIETTSPELETFNNSSQARVFVGRPVYLPLILKGY